DLVTATADEEDQADPENRDDQRHTVSSHQPQGVFRTRHGSSRKRKVAEDHVAPHARHYKPEGRSERRRDRLPHFRHRELSFVRHIQPWRRMDAGLLSPSLARKTNYSRTPFFSFAMTRTTSIRVSGYWPFASFSRDFTMSHTVSRATVAPYRASIST